MWPKIIRIIKNKYFLTGVAFLVWLVFFDNHNLIRRYELSSNLNDLKNEKEFYLEEISKNKKAAEELMTNSELLEKFAREKYLMKKDDEDIYIIVREEEE